MTTDGRTDGCTDARKPLAAEAADLCAANRDAELGQSQDYQGTFTSTIARIVMHEMSVRELRQHIRYATGRLNDLLALREAEETLERARRTVAR